MTPRIGFIIPSVNTVIDDECRYLLPADVSYSSTRITLGAGPGDTRTQLEAFQASAPREAGKLGDARVDAVVLSCTSASFMHGPEHDALLTGQLSETAGCPAISATSAMVAALAAVGATRVLMLTPYEEWLHVLLGEYLTWAGCEVTRARLKTDPVDLGRLAPAELAREVADRVAEVAECPEAVVVSCANAPIFVSIPRLEDTLQLPVISSNQASSWAALNLVGRSTRDLDWGMLAQHDMIATA